MTIKIDSKIAALAAIARTQALVDLIEHDINENPETKIPLEELTHACNKLSNMCSVVITKGLATQEEIDTVFSIMNPDNKITFD